MSIADAPSMSRRQSLTLPLAALAISAVSTSAAGAAPASKWSVNDIAVDMIAKKIAPGVAVAVFEKSRPVYTFAAGSADLELNVPAAVNSVYRIGSVTKQFTAAAVLLLAEDGKLSLDDPLSRFIPEFPHANELTLRRLLNHTSGLDGYLSKTSLPSLALDSRADFDSESLIKLLASAKPPATLNPGKSWSYSNTGYLLLSCLVARASGMSYRDFLHKRIFGPLGLADTAVDDAVEIAPRRVSGYSWNDKASSGFRNADFTSMSFIGGAGAMRSTVVDLCRWHGALLGGKLLRPASLVQMLTPARLADGTLPRNTPREKNGRNDAYGLGLYLSDVHGHRQIAHGGSINGFSAFLASYPERDVSIAYLVNCDDGGQEDSKLDKPLTAIVDRLTAAAFA